MIHVYTGDGKGKTTAAVGLTVRFVGSGKKVAVLQFLKDGTSSENESLKMLNIKVIPCQKTKGFFWEMSDEEKQNLKQETEDGFCCVYGLCCDYDMIVLDEILGALENSLIDEDALLGFLKEYGKTKEIVLTGRKISDKIKSIADYVSSVENVKHPFDRGFGAQKGIEF